MPTFYSPTGNPEVWKEKPIGYHTFEEWKRLHPDPVTYYNSVGATTMVIPGEQIPQGYMTEEEYHNTPHYFEILKAKKVQDIDNKTEKIRDRDGMSYAGERFSMSLQAQANWTKLALGIINNIIQFPYQGVQTIDDKWFVLNSKEEGMAFVLATANYENDPSSPVRQGRELKEKISKVTTKDELDKIVDTRV